MARQRSYINLKGTLGELTFYERNGKSLVRRRGTLDKERIENDPQFRRTRENMNEFKGAAQVGKQFRHSLSALIKQLGGSNVAARITGLIRRSISNGDGKRGRRAVRVLANKDFWSGFEFNEGKSFSYVFAAFSDPPTIDENRNEVQWTVPAFDPENELVVPKGTSHYRFVLATVTLPDYEYHEEKKSYEPVDPSILNLRSVAYTDMLIPDEAFTTPIPLTTDLGLTEALPDSAISISVIGVLFYQEINGEMYALKSEQALKIALVA